MDLITSVIMVLVVGLGFFVQTITGFAGGLIAFPIFLLVTDLHEATAILSIFFFAYSVILLYKNWEFVNRKIIARVALGTIIGLVIGVAVLKLADLLILKKLLGLFTILFVIHSYFQNKKSHKINKLGWLFGFLGGFFSGLFSAGSPPYVAYIYNKLNKPETIRATIIAALAIINFLRIPLIIYTDILTYDIFIKSLFLFPVFFLSLYLGNKFFNRISQDTFKNMVRVLLIITGLMLIIK